MNTNNLPPIISKNKENKNYWKNEYLKMFNVTKCMICLDNLKPINFFNTKCSHSFCGSCILENVVHGNNTCPLCRDDLCSPIDLTPNLNFDTGYHLVQCAMARTKIEGKHFNERDVLKFGLTLAQYFGIWLEEGKNRLVVPDGYYLQSNNHVGTSTSTPGLSEEPLVEEPISDDES